jgi:hypothetical protein
MIYETAARRASSRPLPKTLPIPDRRPPESSGPLVETDFTFCLYGPTGEPILEAAAPAGDVCGDEPCWKARKRGFTYRDGARDPDGLRKVVLTAGEDGKAIVAVLGDGERLPLPPLGLELPLTAQLQAEGGECWEAVLPSARRNDAEVLRAVLE